MGKFQNDMNRSADRPGFPIRIFVASVLLFAAGAARADDTRDALSEYVKCADVSDPGKRLECFDAATGRAKAALAAPVQPAQSAQPAKEKSFLDWFGFSTSKPVTKPEDFGKPAPEPAPGEVTQVSDTVLEFAKTARGKAIFILDNGQIWRQIDGDSTVVWPPSAGAKMKVTIGVGAFNSYNLTIEGRKDLIKVNRLK